MVAIQTWAPAPGPLPSEGHSVVARPIRPDDTERLERLFFRLSPDTVYRRFFQPVHRPSPGMLGYLTGVDHDQREAIVAVADDEIIGVARYDRHRDDPTVAEVAVVVEDAWHHQGVASFLMNRLSRLAAERGVTSFDAAVLAENRPALSLARRLNPRSQLRLAGSEVDLVAPLRAR